MKVVSSSNSLAFAFNAADVRFFCRWAETNRTPLQIYVISAGGSESYQYLNNEWTRSYSLSDFWSQIGHQISDRSGRLSIEIIGNIQRVLRDENSYISGKISSLCGKFSTQHLWPFLRSKFEVELILEEFSPQKILYRGGGDVSLKAFGSGTDEVSKFLSYYSYHRWHLLSEASQSDIEILFLPLSIKDLVRKFAHDQLIGMIVLCYKWLMILKLFLGSIIAKVRNNRVLSNYHTLLVSHSTVHDDVFSRLDLVGPVLQVQDYAVGVQRKTLSDRFEGLELLEFMRPSDFWRAQPRDIALHELLGECKSPASEILEDFSRLNPEFYVYRNALERLLKITRPEVVYFGNDQVTNSSIVARHCMKHGIRSITVQHGWISAPPVNNVPLLSGFFEYSSTFAKTILAEYMPDSDRKSVV